MLQNASVQNRCRCSRKRVHFSENFIAISAIRAISHISHACFCSQGFAPGAGSSSASTRTRRASAPRTSRSAAWCASSARGPRVGARFAKLAKSRRSLECNLVYYFLNLWISWNSDKTSSTSVRKTANSTSQSQTKQTHKRTKVSRAVSTRFDKF